MPGTPSTQQSAGGSSSAPRAPVMRRESSQTSHTSSRHGSGGVHSPGSAEQQGHPLRHAVKPARHVKAVLPRNHSSARNLAKINRQAQAQAHLAAAEEGRKNSRQRSHEGDTEIRLPGSLDETTPTPAPMMRRNLTSYQLPRNTSHSKLKKNFSHGQLTRLGSGRNLAALNNHANKGPPSPGLKGRKKRPKSADFGTVEKDLHEREVELAQRKGSGNGEKKVGFAVGSEEDHNSEGEDLAPEMEGSGLQEDEWTDQSTSASPFSTRQNTANNSRRASMILEKPPDKGAGVEGRQDVTSPSKSKLNMSESAEQNGGSESGSGSGSEDEDDPPSPRSTPHVKKRGEEVEAEPPLELPPPTTTPSKAQQKSPLHAAKDHPMSPATQRILSRTAHNPAPALVSNISALDDAHSAHPSPAPSMRSSKSNIGEGSTSNLDQEDELVSRFIPSTSHPSSGSGGNTALNTPKSSAFHTPETTDSHLRDRDTTSKSKHRSKTAAHFTLGAGPISPGGSTVSGSSGATTPAMARSRTELRLMNEKALAEREDAAKLNPIVPAHVFDRRNESLKSWLNFEASGGGAGPVMKPELFQGRFKAVNTELKVVQRFRDPIGESVRRLRKCKGDGEFGVLRGQGQGQNQHVRTLSSSSAAASPAMQLQQQREQASSLARTAPRSKSAVQLANNTFQNSAPSSQQQQQHVSPGPSKLSTSTSPPKTPGDGSGAGKPAAGGSRGSVQLRRGDSLGGKKGKVTFSQTPPETREVQRGGGGVSGVDDIARQMWEGLL